MPHADEIKTKTNLERMIKLAEEFYDVQNDPEQIQFNSHTITRLNKIHPAVISQKATRNEPVAWGLVLPTSIRLMKLFLINKISENELLHRIRAGKNYESIYLCSLLVLPEYRGKGIAERLILRSVKAIRKEYPVQCLYCWPFSAAGEKLAEKIAGKLHLPLYKKAK